MTIQYQAAFTQTQPPPEIMADPDFSAYRPNLDFYRNQLDQVRMEKNQRSETRFYYTGFGIGVLLDGLAPSGQQGTWKSRALQDGIWLEDLLAEAVR